MLLPAPVCDIGKPMENPAYWTLGVSSLAVGLGAVENSRLWAFLLLQDMVVDSPTCRDHFMQIVSTTRQQLASEHGWATGPSPAAVTCGRLGEHGVLTAKAGQPDPGGDVARARLDVILGWRQ